MSRLQTFIAQKYSGIIKTNKVVNLERNPWLAQNIHATDFLCSIELICLICWLKIVMIIHVSFCTTCRKCGMWDVIYVAVLVIETETYTTFKDNSNM
ncbi:MAG: hypothetical protein MGU50_16760 [Trichodesmium sp. MAG_R02]|nr:hypothetical protein [Trichodesmium sp. MAG_R02]